MMERDPKACPVVGDVWVTTLPLEGRVYRVVTAVQQRCRFPLVSYYRCKTPTLGLGVGKQICWATWRQYINSATYVKNIKPQEPDMGTKLHPRLIRLQLANNGPEEGDRIIWINPDDVTCVSEVQNPHGSGFYPDRCAVDTKQPLDNGFVRHEVVGGVDHIAKLICEGRDDEHSPLLDQTSDEEDKGLTTWGDRKSYSALRYNPD